MKRSYYSNPRELEKTVRGVILTWILAQLRIWRYVVGCGLILLLGLCGCGLLAWSQLVR
jgi:hypothetical protein